MPSQPWSGPWFVAVNLWCTRSIPSAVPVSLPASIPGEDLVLRTIRAPDIDRFAAIHAALQSGKPLSASRRWLYGRVGSKLVWVVETSDRRLVGFNMYYFREREWARGIVHGAFIGVAPDHRRRGLADAMRAAAAMHFARAGVAGISTRIHADNLPSLRSAERQGFGRVGEEEGGHLELLRRLQV
jgi:L-amino acid N-acyltransferase YncA